MAYADAVARDEVDAVDADHAELLGDDAGQRARGVRQSLDRTRRPRRRPRRGCCRSTGSPTRRTRGRRRAGARCRAARPDRRRRRRRPTRTCRRRTPAGSSRAERAWCAATAARGGRRQRPAASPASWRVAGVRAIARTRMSCAMHGRSRAVRCADGRRRAAGTAARAAKRLADEARIAHAAEHLGCVAPQRAPGGEQRSRLGDDSRSWTGTRPRRTRCVRAARAAACAVTGAPKSRRSERLRTEAC